MWPVIRARRAVGMSAYGGKVQDIPWRNFLRWDWFRIIWTSVKKARHCDESGESIEGRCRDMDHMPPRGRERSKFYRRSDDGAVTGEVLIVKPSLLVIPAPGITARAGRPIEAIVVFFGESAGGESGTATAIRLPQGAREGAVEGPEHGEEPDGEQHAGTAMNDEGGVLSSHGPLRVGDGGALLASPLAP